MKCFTVLNASRVQTIFPNPLRPTAFCVPLKTIGKALRTNIGNAYQFDRKNPCGALLVTVIIRCPNSQNKKIVPNAENPKITGKTISTTFVATFERK